MKVKEEVLHEHESEDNIDTGFFHEILVDEVRVVAGLVFGDLRVGMSQQSQMRFAPVLQGQLEFTKLGGDVHLFVW